MTMSIVSVEGPHDNVKCFCCDIGLKNWQIDDNPWIEHARWSPRCRYLREMKDDAFIEEAVANRNRVSESFLIVHCCCQILVYNSIIIEFSK